MKFLGKLLGHAGRAARTGGRYAAKAGRTIIKVGKSGPGKYLGKKGLESQGIYADPLKMAAAYGPNPQQYADGSWETEAHVRVRVKHEKARQSAASVEASKRIADQDAAYERELALSREGTRKDIERRDYLRGYGEPDYELDFHKQLGISKYQGRMLVMARLARQEAREKRTGSYFRQGRKSAVRATGAFTAFVGVAMMLSQCEEPKPQPTPSAQEQPVATTVAVAPVAPTMVAQQPTSSTSAQSPEAPSSTGPAVSSSRAPLDPTPTTTETTVPTTTTTATTPVIVQPIAWTQAHTYHCNPDDQLYQITTSYIIRDIDSGEDLVDEYQGALVTIHLDDGAGGPFSASTTISNAFMEFVVTISPPATGIVDYATTLDVGGVPVVLSYGSHNFGSLSFCTWDS